VVQIVPVHEDTNQEDYKFLVILLFRLKLCNFSNLKVSPNILPMSKVCHNRLL
jgi:hypothetical protein